MKKMALWKKLTLATVVICGLFFGGITLAQNLSEQSILAASNNQETEEEAIARTQKEFERIDKMSVQEYYIDYLDYDPRIMADFEEKYAEDANEVKIKDLDNEKSNYLMALTSFYENGDQPILARNEQKENGEVIIGANGEYAYSLETLSGDVAALSDAIDSTTPIIEICVRHGVDPEGKIRDLTPEIIVEIDRKLFEISDHPK
ncbi:hypothetical protein [Candidatus Enterococcus clewellii]|uniref:Uncharacterized protein n=1 Tax=Candidatus Enterococcus clewellii TaxID=1834193 RepID=A0A242K1R0_9ENTE|nr:hypothetical protein [Enterococcus sp. 9E7_DIV0242]OTP11590.1 hypothetical protein A5888_003689 [Enterococcus sp. 9E7_DIV0242]